MTTSSTKMQIDLVLVTCGLVVGFATPISLMSRISNTDLYGLEVVNVLRDRPALSVPAVLFAIAGFTVLSVGLNGLRGKYADIAERFDGIYRTAASTSVVCVAAFCLLLALSHVVAFIEYRDVRVLATIIGALVGLHCSGYVDGNENTPAAFAFAGGLMGYLAAPALLLFLAVAALLMFGGPLIAWFLGRSMGAPATSGAAPPALTNGNQNGFTTFATRSTS